MMNMKKKEYIVPVCEVLEMETVSMIASSPNFGVGGAEDEEDENDTGNMSNCHRGEWGNLWGNKK